MAEDLRHTFATHYISNVCQVLGALPLHGLTQVLETLERAYTQRCQVFLAGNGGSAATASHMANDLVKGIVPPGKPGIRAIALTDNVPLLTAIANDEGYQEVFARQLAELGRPGDVLIVISASGNSRNIVRAVEVAQEIGITTIGFLGMGGGKVASMVDISVIAPSDEYGPVEDAHMVLDHLTMAYLRRWLAGISHDLEGRS